MKTIYMMVLLLIFTLGCSQENNVRTAPVDGIKTAQTAGEVDKEWLKDVLSDGVPENIRLIDVRSAAEFGKMHFELSENMPIGRFDRHGGCEDYLPMISDGKYNIFFCGYGPRSVEMYYNIVDPVSEGGCGFADKDKIYFLNATVDFDEDSFIIK